MESLAYWQQVQQSHPILLTYAQTMDGVMGYNGPLALSNTQAMKMTHLIRHCYDGIVVGINTVLLDDPILTCRADLPNPSSPRPIVMDRQLRFPLSSRLASRSPILVHSSSSKDTMHLTSKGIDCIYCPDLTQLMTLLTPFGIQSIMIEGGPTVLQSFSAISNSYVITVKKTILGEGTRVQHTVDLKNSQMVDLNDNLIIMQLQ